MALLIAAILVLPVCTLAQEESDAPKRRPRIGLALGGGGARGGAHIGILKRLEELRIPIDYIAGTSIGSIAGGLYASGLSPEDMSEIITTTDWDALLNDSIPRRDQPYRRKQESYLDLFAIEVGISRGGFRIPDGLVAGQKLEFLLRGLTLHVAQVEDFDLLGVPYRAVATDLDDGGVVVIGGGDLADAMRASMAIPGFFTPAEYYGELLVDGGVVQNLPVQTVRAMGADIVIAVDVGTPPAELASERMSLLSVAARTVGVLTAANTKESLADLGPDDFLIVPDLDGITTLDFAAIGEAESRGIAVMDSFVTSLSELSVSEEEYASYLARQRAPAKHSDTHIRIDRIVVVGEHRVPEQMIVRRLQLKPGDELNLELLQQDLLRIYQLGEFEQVDFHIREQDGQTVLEIDAREKFWGPDYLRFGLRLEGNFKGSGGFLFNVLHRKSFVNRWGAEWRNLLTGGDMMRLRTEFDQPLGYSARFFVAPILEYIRVQRGAYLSPHSKVILDGDTGFGEMDVGYRASNDFEFRTGLRFGFVDAQLGAAAEELDVADQIGLWSTRATLDDLDSANFPYHGFFTEARLELGRTALGSTYDYDRLYVNLLKPFSRGNTSFVFNIEGGSDLGSDLPLYDEFAIGGLFRLSGFENDQVRGDTMLRGGIIWTQRMGTLNPLLGEGIYAGISLEAGNALASGETWQLSDVIPAGAVYAGLDSVFGPIYVAWGVAEGGFETFYFVMGHPHEMGLLR